MKSSPKPLDRSFLLDSGGRRGVLLIHGMTGVPGEMRFVAKRLARRGLTVSAPQLAGHGGTLDDLLRTDWTDWLQSVREAHDRLAARVDEVFVAGICLGGALGLLLAAERPQIAGAAIYSMTFEYDGWNMPRPGVMKPILKLAATLPGFRRLSFEEPYPFGLKDERLRDLIMASGGGVMAGALDRIPLAALRQMRLVGRRLERKADQIQARTLILHAEHDDMSHPRNALRLQAALGARSSLHILHDSYHMIHVDKERDRVGDLTADFFDSLSVTGAGAERFAHG
jgi:carboxylesterase